MERMHVAERSTEDLFTTITLLTLDRATATATLHLAGHHGPLLTEHGRTREVPARLGLALGVRPGQRRWYATEIPLPAAGALTLYTDGLVEGYDGDEGQRLGLEGLLPLMDGSPDTDPAAHLDRIIAEARRRNDGRHTDDLAVLRLDWTGLPSVPRQASALHVPA